MTLFKKARNTLFEDGTTHRENATMNTVNLVTVSKPEEAFLPGGIVNMKFVNNFKVKEVGVM